MMKFSSFSRRSACLVFCLAAVTGCTQHEEPQPPISTPSSEAGGANAVGSVLNEALTAYASDTAYRAHVEATAHVKVAQAGAKACACFSDRYQP